MDLEKGPCSFLAFLGHTVLQRVRGCAKLVSAYFPENPVWGLYNIQKRPTSISRIWRKNFIHKRLTLSNLMSDHDIVADRADTMTELKTVEHVDVARYMGT
jgi:hypothetical protein